MRTWSANDWVLFLGSAGTFIAGLAAATLKILAAVREIHLSINSRLDELVSSTRAASLAEGREMGRKETKHGTG